jgi:hypothetical protein
MEEPTLLNITTTDATETNLTRAIGEEQKQQQQQRNNSFNTPAPLLE